MKKKKSDNWSVLIALVAIIGVAGAATAFI
ncbi:hypothetical protein MMIC_P1725 [Mariprofundus micogutta]|uniref:Uncharacterized protein n=1 Tax=Mariprofundus micogutta TaxID=1921010 RepID=A0A1L8CPA6_9PROT|nr:hypothetical protein MMIC_P1725 [Mariprofundus micogutta]